MSCSTLTDLHQPHWQRTINETVNGTPASIPVDFTLVEAERFAFAILTMCGESYCLSAGLLTSPTIFNPLLSQLLIVTIGVRKICVLRGYYSPSFKFLRLQYITLDLWTLRAWFTGFLF